MFDKITQGFFSQKRCESILANDKGIVCHKRFGADVYSYFDKYEMVRDEWDMAIGLVKVEVKEIDQDSYWITVPVSQVENWPNDD